MQAPENLTDFAVACMPTMGLGGRDMAVLIIAGTYSLPQPGQGTAVKRLGDQPEVPLAPTFRGDPSCSSLVWEGQVIPSRPGTDIYVDGLAWAPRGQPASTTTVGVRVGPASQQALVFGDRRWRVGGVASSPEPFVSMPLIYERCFGGFIEGARGQVARAAEHNPIGRGLYGSVAPARGQPLPNIEDPRALIRSPLDLG